MKDFKIISIENNKKLDFEIVGIKDILIPCWMYMIPIRLKNNTKFNFIEDTIYKLISFNEKLKNDPVEISKMLGFYDSNKSKDKTDIIRFVLSKLSDHQLDANGDDLHTEQKNFTFFQDAYSFKMLSIVANGFNDFIHNAKITPFKNNFKNIEFKKNKNIFKALLIDSFESGEPKILPTKKDFIQALNKHNKERLKGEYLDKIDYRELIFGELEPELIYLHSKLIILENSNVVITNGWTNDFSNDLQNIFSNNLNNELLEIKQNFKIDFEWSNEEKDVFVPFDDKIKQHINIYHILKNIQKETIKISSPDSKSEMVKNSRLLEYLYDIMEIILGDITSEYDDVNNIKNYKLIYQKAQEIHFKSIDKCGILKSSDKNDIRKFICKAIIFHSNLLQPLPLKNPFFLLDLNCLFTCRGMHKHANKDVKKNNMPLENILSLKDKILEAVSILLKIPQKQECTKEMHDEFCNFNFYVQLDEVFGVESVAKMSDQLKSELICIMSSEKEHNLNDLNYILVSICKIWEIFFLEILQAFFQTNTVKDARIIKDEVCAVYDIQAGEGLDTVKINSLQKAIDFKGKATLGAYAILYLYDNIKNSKSISRDFIQYIFNITKLRGHGNNDSSRYNNFNAKNFENLYNDTIEYAKIFCKNF